jgi:uncharacterized protein involved in type VI secretion and phage assembly
VALFETITTRNFVERDERHKLYGAYIGVVTQHKHEADGVHGPHCIKIKLPGFGNGDQETAYFARVAGVGLGNNEGVHWVPDVNDEVVVIFVDGEISHPVVVGSLHSKTSPAIEENADTNKLKVWQTKCGHRFEFDDDETKITLTSKSKHVVCLDDKAKTITVKTGDGNHSMVMDQGAGITCKTTKDFVVEATQNIKLTASQKIMTKSTSNTEIEATGSLKAKGTAGFEITTPASGKMEASGPLTIKGAVVNIN